MNFVTSVFKKYLNKNEGKQQEGSKRDNNIAQPANEQSKISVLKGLDSVYHDSESQKYNATSSNDEEESFQDAETTPATTNITRDSLDTTQLKDNHPKQIATSNVSSNMEYGKTANRDHLKKNYPDIVSQNPPEPDSLNTSMVDSLEVGKHQEISLPHELIDSIEILQYDSKDSSSNSIFTDPELEEYRSLSQNEADPIENLSTSQKLGNIRNATATIIKNNDEEEMNKMLGKIDNPINDNILDQTNPVSLKHMLCPNPDIAESTTESTAQEEAKIHNPNFITEEYPNKVKSAFDVLIQNVNHTFGISDSVNITDSNSNKSPIPLPSNENIALQNGTKGQDHTREQEGNTNMDIVVPKQNGLENISQELVAINRKVSVLEETEYTKQKCDQIEEDVKNLKAEEIIPRIIPDNMRSERELNQSENNIVPQQEIENTLNSIGITLENVESLESIKELESVATGNNNKEEPKGARVKTETKCKYEHSKAVSAKPTKTEENQKETNIYEKATTGMDNECIKVFERKDILEFKNSQTKIKENLESEKLVENCIQAQVNDTKLLENLGANSVISEQTPQGKTNTNLEENDISYSEKLMKPECKRDAEKHISQVFVNLEIKGDSNKDSTFCEELAAKNTQSGEELNNLEIKRDVISQPDPQDILNLKSVIKKQDIISETKLLDEFKTADNIINVVAGNTTEKKGSTGSSERDSELKPNEFYERTATESKINEEINKIKIDLKKNHEDVVEIQYNQNDLVTKNENMQSQRDVKRSKERVLDQQDPLETEQLDDVKIKDVVNSLVAGDTSKDSNESDIKVIESNTVLEVLEPKPKESEETQEIIVKTEGDFTEKGVNQTNKLTDHNKERESNKTLANTPQNKNSIKCNPTLKCDELYELTVNEHKTSEEPNNSQMNLKETHGAVGEVLQYNENNLLIKTKIDVTAQNQIDIKLNEKEIEQKCSEVFERQDTQECENVEQFNQNYETNTKLIPGTLTNTEMKGKEFKAFEDNKQQYSVNQIKNERKNKNALANIPESKASISQNQIDTKRSGKEREQTYNAASERQDTQECENLEQFTENFETGTKLKLDILNNQEMKGKEFKATEERKRLDANSKLDRKKAVNHTEKEIERNCNRLYERQDIKEFENLEKQFEENLGTGIVQKSRNIQEELKVDRNNIEVEFKEKSFKRQDTREFESLERECTENGKPINELITDDILGELVSENKANRERQQSCRILNQNQTIGEENSMFYRQDTREFEIIERQCRENAEDFSNMGIESFEKLIADSHDQSMKETKVIKQDISRDFYRQDTQEFEKLEKQCKEVAEDQSLKLNNILEELVAESTNRNHIIQTEPTLEQEEKPTECEKAEENLKVDIMSYRNRTEIDENKLVENMKKSEDLRMQIVDNKTIHKLEAEGTLDINLDISDSIKDESGKSGHKIVQTKDHIETKPLLEIETAQTETEIQQHNLKFTETESTDISKFNVREKDSTQNKGFKCKDFVNEEDAICQRNLNKCANSFEAKSKPPANRDNEIKHIDKKQQCQEETDKVEENASVNEDNSKYFSSTINFVKGGKQINKVEVRPNIRNKLNQTKPASPVVEDELGQGPSSANTNRTNERDQLCNEYKSKNEELKSKVDTLQQELDSIRKVNRRKDQCIVTSTMDKDADKEIVLKYRNLLQEYEKRIAQQTEDLEKLKMESERNIRHFTNTEMAFSDVFEKYEKAKSVIEAYRRNEDILLENIQNAEEQLSQYEAKCLAMKNQSVGLIRRAHEQVEREKAKYKQDIAKLQAHVKILEIKASSLEIAVQQKTEECQALAALCDDITGRSST